MTEVDTLHLDTLQNMAAAMYGNMVKAVVDVAKNRLVVDSELHVDQEKFLLETGSVQADLWGINLYPEHFGTDDFIEFDSMINIRPGQGNRTRGVDDPHIQNQIQSIIAGKINK